jgi:hypothetical protein
MLNLFEAVEGRKPAIEVVRYLKTNILHAEVTLP